MQVSSTDVLKFWLRQGSMNVLRITEKWSSQTYGYKQTSCWLCAHMLLALFPLPQHNTLWRFFFNQCHTKIRAPCLFSSALMAYSMEQSVNMTCYATWMEIILVSVCNNFSLIMTYTCTHSILSLLFSIYFTLCLSQFIFVSSSDWRCHCVTLPPSRSSTIITNLPSQWKKSSIITRV